MLAWALWLVWSFGVVFLSRIALAALLRLWLPPRKALTGAYAGLAGFLVIGVLINSPSGMQMYGFDNSSWREWTGYITLVFSPFGAPLIVGTPLTIIADLVRRSWRQTRKGTH